MSKVLFNSYENAKKVEKIKAIKLMKNADELKAEDSAGMAVNEVIKEAEDEIVKTINTTETTQDKTET